MGKKKGKRSGGLTARGGGDMHAQIEKLEELVKPKGVKQAREIVEGYEPDVIKLAFKYLRRTERAAGPSGLGSRIEGLLAAMPEAEANQMRAKLLEAKAAKAEL